MSVVTVESVIKNFLVGSSTVNALRGINLTVEAGDLNFARVSLGANCMAIMENILFARDIRSISKVISSTT